VSLTVHPEAHALSAFRVLPNGNGRAYSATFFPRDPWAGLEQFIRQGHAVGAIKSNGDGPDYAVLDVLNEEGDIVQDFTIPTADAFQQVRRRLKLVVLSEDGDHGAVSA
jgi:hypothetical protein